MAEPPKPKRWALLIGASFYMTGNARTDDAGRTIHYHNLGGCVNDVTLVETFLRDEVGVPSDHIAKLTSSPPVDDSAQNEPREDPAVWPTYLNMARAFGDLLASAERGDLVYVHYSGHGARVRTAYPGLKGGPDGLDEALVPVDIEVEVASPAGPPQGRYVRDVEVAGWMRALVDKGLLVTVVLDSCHAGSSNRSRGDVTTRGIDAVDHSLLPHDLTPHVGNMNMPDLDHSAAGAGTGGYRGGRLQRNWLLEASGYTLLAACTAYERAHEFKPAERTHGVLSYYLVESLRCCSGYTTSSSSSAPPPPPSGLLGCLIAKVQSHFPGQTPILDGRDDGAALFGIRAPPSAPRIRVLAVGAGGARDAVELDHGDLHGLHVGAEYGLHGGSDEDLPRSFAARVRIAEVRGLTSVARLIPAADSPNQPAVQPGWVASLVRPARERLSVVRVVAGGESTTTRQPGQAATTPRLEQLQRLLGNPRNSRDSPGRLWRLMAGDERDVAAALSVRISEDGCYELLDASLAPVPNLPRLPIVDASSGDKLLRFLDHIARFRLLQRLSANQASVLRTPCLLDVLGKSTAPPLEPTPDGPGGLVFPAGLEEIGTVDGTYTVRHGEVVSIRFKNLGLSPVYFALFDLKPLWGVAKLYPDGGGWAEPVGPGEERVLPIQMEIPPSLRRGGGRTEILDTFRAVVTTRETPLKVFELPEIAQESARGSGVGDFWVDFDCFLQGWGPASRDFKLKGQSRAAWQVYDIRVQTTSESMP